VLIRAGICGIGVFHFGRAKAGVGRSFTIPKTIQ
jgi:hypothetical protein